MLAEGGRDINHLPPPTDIEQLTVDVEANVVLLEGRPGMQAIPLFLGLDGHFDIALILGVIHPIKEDIDVLEYVQLLEGLHGDTEAPGELTKGLGSQARL